MLHFEKQRLWVKGHVDWAIGFVKVGLNEVPEASNLDKDVFFVGLLSLGLDDVDDGVTIKKGEDVMNVVRSEGVDEVTQVLTVHGLLFH